MIQREAEKELITLSLQFKAVVVTGPRQSGKTTLVRNVFKDKPYANLENPDLRSFAHDDPRGFLANFPDGAILDEVQRVPEIFSYLQQILDEKNIPGLFILTGSNNFLIQENISQSLAGRVGYLFLLPLCLNEIPDKSDINKLIFTGCYPALHDSPSDPSRFYSNYIRTYVERDVRLIKNITDLYAFERLLKLCAGRIGQLLNMSSLAVEVGVDVKTINSWLTVLETGFIIFRLQPYYENFNKRLVKMPKIYFYDTGLASSLLGIESPSQLVLNSMRGSLFENAVIVDFLKRRYNNGKSNNLYFWRDNTGNEIDLVLAGDSKKIPVEIKSGQTISNEFSKGILFWNKITDSNGGFIIYSGEDLQKRSNGITYIPFKSINSFEERIV